MLFKVIIMSALITGCTRHSVHMGSYRNALMLNLPLICIASGQRGNCLMSSGVDIRGERSDMKVRKSDRWERMVGKLETKYKTPGIERVTFTPDAVVKILRKEHRAVVRMVSHNPLYGASSTEWKRGYAQACQDILDQLKKRAT